MLLVAISTVVYILWLLRKVMKSWTNVAHLLASIALAQFLVGITILAVGAIVYRLTIYRAKQYAQWLREAGYVVHLDTTTVKEFTVAAIVAVITTPLAVLITWNQYFTHQCITTGACFNPGLKWYFFAIVIPLLSSLIAIGSLYSAITIWWNSFASLKHHWERMQRGEAVELQRSISTQKK